MTERRKRQARSAALTALAAVLWMSLATPAFAVVGQAEKFNPFEAQKLEEFQYNITHEEEKKQLEKSDDIAGQLKKKAKELKNAKGEAKQIMKEELEQFKKQLLTLPKRDKVRFSISGTQTTDTNANSSPQGDEDNDSTFDTSVGAAFDLSGRRTDLRFDLAGQKSWSIEYPEKDIKGVQETLRFRRKFFKKITTAAQSRIARENSKTVEIKGEKVRWDSAQSVVSNFAFSRRLSLNTDSTLNHRYFAQEAFDQDSSWDTGSAPSAFWQFTPRSRAAAGYKIAQSRSHSKTGNTVAHEIHIGYFGQVTRKSSASVDLSAGKQVPRELSGSIVKTLNTGVGYIWQWTPKTQLTLQLVRSQQNSTSNPADNSTAASATAETVVEKTSTYIKNTSGSLALNSRLNSKLRATLTGTLNYSTTHTDGGAPDADADHAQYGYQVSVALSYLFSRYLSFASSYTFQARMGDESSDASKGHTWKSGMQISF
ncbi:MAG TPA: hypothetical protein VJC08_00225 [bacterium]|nr:hypothetical protein [bacterium]